VALSTVPFGSAEAAGHKTPCRDIGQQSDTGVYNIRALNISCRTARSLLRHWQHDASAPDAGPRGWRCRVHRTGPYSERHHCSRKQRRIAFTLFYA
jgi:hypothetical protein